MTLKYIRDQYGVPARRGMQVIVNGGRGVITGATKAGAYINVRFGQEKRPTPCHPTWEVQYLEPIRQPIPSDVDYGFPVWREGCRYFVYANHTSTPELEWYLVSCHKNPEAAIEFAKTAIREMGKSRWLIVLDAKTKEMLTEHP